MSNEAWRWMIGTCLVFAAALELLRWVGHFDFWSIMVGAIWGCGVGTILQFERMEGRL